MFFLRTFLLTLFLSLTTVLIQAQQSDKIQWVSVEEAQSKAMEDGKSVFIFVEAEWCGLCKRMHRVVFPKQNVSDLMGEKYHAVLLDLDSDQVVKFNGEETSERELARKLNVMATPTMIFLDSNGEFLGSQRGFLGQNEFLKLLTYVESDQFEEVSFQEFSIDDSSGE